MEYKEISKIEANPEKRWSQLLHKILIEERPPNISLPAWKAKKKEELVHLIKSRKIDSSDVYHLGRSLVLGDKGGKVGDGTWIAKDPVFVDALRTAADDVQKLIATQLKQEAQNLKVARDNQVEKLNHLWNTRPPERNTTPEVLKDINALMQMPGNHDHLIKYLASKISIKPNPSAINKAIAESAIAERRKNGIVLEADVIRLTKHLDPADQQEILTKFRETGGEKSVGVFKDYHEKRTAMVNRIKRGANWTNQLGGKGNPHESAQAKINEAIADFDSRIIEYLPAAAQVADKDKDPYTQEKVWKIATDMAFNAFNKDWDNSEDGEGKYATRTNPRDKNLKEYTYTEYGKGAYEIPPGERYFEGDTLLRFKETLKQNPDALIDPNEEQFVSSNDLANMVHSLNRGEPFVPTPAIKSLADEVEIDGVRGNSIGLLLMALERHQRVDNNQKKLELTEETLQNHPALWMANNRNSLSKTLKTVVGEDKPASAEGSDVFNIEISERTEKYSPWTLRDIKTNPYVADYLKTDTFIENLKNINEVRKKEGLDELEFQPVLPADDIDMYGIPGNTEEVAE